MPKILFDPDNEFELCKVGKPIRGGALTGANRCEYVELCKQITSRDHTLDYKSIGNRILEIMRNDVIEYINTLPEEDRPYLLEDINTFYSTIDKSDKSIISTINTIGLQIAILFTTYLEDPDDQEKYHFFSYDFYTQIMVNEEWKNNTKLKKMLMKKSEFSFLLNRDRYSNTGVKPPIFLAFIGFLSLRELMESYFNNVFYCGLSYTIEYVDGSFANPMTILWHDKFHFDEYSSIYNCAIYPTYINYLQKFYTYAMNNLSKPEQYAINFELFLDMHETQQTIHNLCKKGINNLKEYLSDKSNIYNSLINNMDDLANLQNIGKAIPKEYRVLLKNSNNELDKSKIQEYLNYVAETIEKCFKAFESQTGGRRNRKTKKRRAHKPRKTCRV